MASDSCTVTSDGGAGHVPLLALVLLARIWTMSGNVRDGSVVVAFSPGDGEACTS